MNYFECVFKEDPESDMAYCSSCLPDPDFIKRRKDEWNTDLLTETYRICNICGNTKQVRRLKDEPGRFSCRECNSETKA